MGVRGDALVVQLEEKNPAALLISHERREEKVEDLK